ncbi:MAG: hypothetical protein RLZZ493_788 [Bacteroidota bacterium]
MLRVTVTRSINIIFALLTCQLFLGLVINISLMFYVYILKSLSSGDYYVGMTKDIQVRLKEHNSGKSKFTKGHLPFELVYQEGPFPTEEARKREKQLKLSEDKQRIISKLA